MKLKNIPSSYIDSIKLNSIHTDISNAYAFIELRLSKITVQNPLLGTRKDRVREVLEGHVDLESSKELLELNKYKINGAVLKIFSCKLEQKIHSYKESPVSLILTIKIDNNKVESSENLKRDFSVTIQTNLNSLLNG